MVNETTAKEWLTNHMATLLKIAPSDIDTSITFDEYGLESGVTMALLADYEKWLGGELSLEILERSPSIDQLAALCRQ